MKTSTILNHIDSGHMALPEFQRGYVWNRDQVRGLFDSLYRHPIGGLLVLATEATIADYRGEGPVTAGIVKLLLDGQQRMTSLYGVVRGRVPKFFDGNEAAFTGLRFHLESETYSFHKQSVSGEISASCVESFPWMQGPGQVARSAETARSAAGRVLLM